MDETSIDTMNGLLPYLSAHCCQAVRCDAAPVASDFVFTVCEKASGEVCPVWPGQAMTAHWGVADPAAFEGTDDQRAKVFWDMAVVFKRRIELMLALPLASLDKMAIQREIKDIGTR